MSDRDRLKKSKGMERSVDGRGEKIDPIHVEKTRNIRARSNAMEPNQQSSTQRAKDRQRETSCCTTSTISMQLATERCASDDKFVSLLLAAKKKL